MTDELVMVVPRADLFRSAPAWQGFSGTAEAYLRPCLEGYLFMPRRRAETSPAYKQIIPYVVLQTPAGHGGQHRYLIFQRVQGGDPRLGRLYSIGLGGHINSTDASALAQLEIEQVAARRSARPAGEQQQGPAGQTRRRLARRITLAPSLREEIEPFLGPTYSEHPLFRGIWRELREELVLPPQARLSLLGAINDDGNAVGEVHFGLAFLLQLPGTVEVRLRRETDSVQVGDLLPFDQVMSYRHSMETWSSLLLDSGVLPRAPQTGSPAGH